MSIKQVFFGFIANVAIIGNAFAVEVCAKTGTYVGILKVNVDGDNYQINNDQKQWMVNYNYKTITGLAACNEIDGTFATPATNLVTSYADSGQNCWCKMEPVSDFGYETGIVSYWVFLSNEYDDTNACDAACTEHCATAMADNQVFRSGVFNSLW